MSTNVERLLTLNEVARLLGVSRRQVYRRISRGELPSQVRKGRSVWLPESEVEAHIEKLKEARPPVCAIRS